MAVLPPFHAPQRADEAVVRIPPLELTPVNTGLLLAAASVLFDQATKELAARTLIPNRQVDLFPDAVPFFGDGWGWQLIFNPGGALGFDPERLTGVLGSTFGSFLGDWFFVLVTLLVTVIVVRNLPLAQHVATGAAYGLLLGGAWGNGLNRMLRPPGFPRGQVVDFLAIRVPEFFPVGPDLARFNFADVAILLGFAVLLWSLSAEA